MDHTLMVILMCAAAFCAGAAVVYTLTGFYVNSILAGKPSGSGDPSEKRSSRFRFFFIPEIGNLKKQSDSFKKRMEEMAYDLEDEKSLSSDLQQENATLRKQLAEGERQIRELARIIHGSPEKAGLDVTRRQSSLASGRNPSTTAGNKKVVYFGIPDSDGNFSEDKGSPNPDDRKLYRIVTDQKGETGELHYVPGMSDLKAIDNIDFYLIPVCEVENIPDRSFATKVIQKEAGRVVLISGKWVCDKKIKVKLI